MTNKNKPLTGAKFERFGRVTIRAENGAENRTVELSVSSETPYDRYFGAEILSHAEDAVDLSRLNDIGVLLWNHDRDAVIGRINRAWIENERLCAEATFDDDEESNIIYNKVSSGTLKGVSVGYRVDVWEEVLPGKQSSCGKFTGPCFIARKWMPLEVSIVSVPADATVGVGRSEEINEEEINRMNANINDGASTVTTETAPETNITASTPTSAEETRTFEDGVSNENARVSEIQSLCRDFGVDATNYIADRSITADRVRADILDGMRSNGTVNVRVTRDEGDTFREAAAQGLALRGGVNLENVPNEARKYANLSLRNLAIESLRADGVEGIGAYSSDDDVYNAAIRSFYNPTAAFPSIMEQMIRKSYENTYSRVSTTFEAFCAEGTLTDFKKTNGNYYAGAAGEFLEVPENGEIVADKPNDYKRPSRQLKTFGRQFSMSRQAFINDDIGYLATIPGRYAESAKRTINNQVYKMLYDNGTIFDGKTLFHAEHGNLIEAGAAPSIATIQSALLKLKLQKDEDGTALNITPRYIIVPVGYGFALTQALHSPTVKTAENGEAVNVLYNSGLEIIEDATLNGLAGTGACPWFIAADKMSCPGIQVDYLNGQKVPTIRRSEKAGTLGFIWDIYLDWGVTAIDYRGLVKNPGVALN